MLCAKRGEKMLGNQAVITRLNHVSHGFHHEPPGTKFNYSTHMNTCELIYIRQGTSTVTWNERQITETAPFVRFLPNTGAWVNYRAETLASPVEWYLFSCQMEHAPDQLLFLPLSSADTVERLFSAMWRAWSMRQEGYYHRCLSIAYEIMTLLDQPRYLPKEQADVLAPAIAEMEKNLFGTVDCSTLHELCGVSYTHFKNLFIRRYGMPPKKYITRLKMQIACEQLERNQLTIAQISDLLGYSGPGYFSRLFHQEMGCTAEMYRRRMQDKENSLS